MRRLVLLAVVAALVGVLAGHTGAAFRGLTSDAGNSFAAAASFCSGSTQTASAEADSWVDQLLPVLNHGSDTSLSVEALTLSNRRALVRFTLPSIPKHCAVTTATLRLYATAATNGRTLQAYRAAASWTESTVNWSNQPATTGTAATAASGTGYRDWAVTTQVQAMYSGSNTGFIVKDSNEASPQPRTQTFSSREAASNRPQLVITFG
jgi:hypothetical protein